MTQMGNVELDIEAAWGNYTYVLSLADAKKLAEDLLREIRMFEQMDEAIPEAKPKCKGKSCCGCKKSKICPITEGPSKGGHNPPNMSCRRPPAPKGSGVKLSGG